MLNLRWRGIGEDAIKLPDSKTGPRAAPLGEAALWPTPATRRAHLFSSHAEGLGLWNVTQCCRTVCADAKLGRLRLRSLRRTAASHAVMSGENLPLVGKLLGHCKNPYGIVFWLVVITLVGLASEAS